MPGKVNPVIPEVVNQVAFSVIGADATVTAAAEAGQLQLNAFEPVIAHSLLQSLAWMTNACYTLRVNCIDGITANTARLSSQVESSVGVVTALTPYIGYAAAAALAHTALTTNASIAELVVSAGLHLGGGGRPRALARAAQRRGSDQRVDHAAAANSSAGPESDRPLVVLHELGVGLLDSFLGVDRRRGRGLLFVERHVALVVRVRFVLDVVVAIHGSAPSAVSRPSSQRRDGVARTVMLGS